MYIARNLDGSLILYRIKPRRRYETYELTDSMMIIDGWEWVTHNLGFVQVSLKSVQKYVEVNK